VRKSLKSLRDPDAFAKAKRELEALQKQEDQGQIALYYFDEAGFALDPTIPYALARAQERHRAACQENMGGSMCSGL